MARGWGMNGSHALPASAKMRAELDTVVGQVCTPSLEYQAPALYQCRTAEDSVLFRHAATCPHL